MFDCGANVYASALSEPEDIVSIQEGGLGSNPGTPHALTNQTTSYSQLASSVTRDVKHHVTDQASVLLSLSLRGFFKVISNSCNRFDLLAYTLGFREDYAFLVMDSQAQSANSSAYNHTKQRTGSNGACT